MKMIYFHTHNATQVQALIGKFLFRSGRQSFLALNKVNRSEKLQEIMAYRMKQYGVFFVLLESTEQVDNCF